MKVEPAILRRLGPIPFWRGERKCLDALESVYRVAMEAAKACAAGGFRPPARPAGRK